MALSRCVWLNVEAPQLKTINRVCLLLGFSMLYITFFPIAIKSKPWLKCDVFHLLWLFLVTLTPSHPKCKTFQRQWEGQDREWSLSFLSRRRGALVLPPGRQKGSARLYFLRNIYCKCKIENFHLASVRSDTSRGDWGEHDEAWQRPDID